MDFAKWLKHTRPEWRGSKPILKGKTWRTQRDPWRGVRRTALGMDYLKPCNIRTTDDETRAAYHNADAKMVRALLHLTVSKWYELSMLTRAK